MNTATTKSGQWENQNQDPRDTEQDASKAPTLKPSPYQQALKDWTVKGKGNGIVVAVAGAGKTTALLMAANALPSLATAYAVVFNKRNAEELKAKFPRNVWCGTFHSLWMRACRANLGSNVRVDEYKTQRLIETVLPTTVVNDSRTGRPRKIVIAEYRDYIPLIKRLVGMAKNSGVGKLIEDDPITYRTFLDYYDFDIDDNINVDALIAYTQRTLKLSQEDAAIDFDDMLYLPLLNNWGIERRSFVFVDEAQDTNAVQRELVKRMVSDRGRVVFVGDPHQAIYGFRGATNDAMTVIKDEFDAHEMPLTVSYRCPKSVVAYAKSYVKHIESCEMAQEGTVLKLSYVPSAMLVPNAAIVCRTTAPLVSLALTLIGRRVACKILGRDIGQRLIERVKKTRAKTLDEVTESLEMWRQRECARSVAKKDETIAQVASDIVASLDAVISSLPGDASVEDLIAELDSLFSNSVGSVLTLCTVHKAKGLEWDKVTIIRPDLLPLTYVKKKWQKQQEKNLAYVAATRSKHTLVIVSGDEVVLEK